MQADARKIIQARKLVGELLRGALAGKITPLEASSRFPKDIEDKSIDTAFHALMHFEADEDLRAQDTLYAQEQDEYLETISNILISGESIPRNIIAEYNEYYSGSPVYRVENRESFFKKMCRLINM